MNEILNISGDIEAHRRQTTFWNCQNKGNFEVFVLRIIHVEVVED